jgi:protein-tyrosine phosphatase
MIDLHCHLLPGIDDGSSSIEQSVAVLHGFAAEGVTDVALTPHLRASDIGPRGEIWVARRDQLLEELSAAAPAAVRLHPGFEIMLDQPLPTFAVGDRRFALAGSRYYLVEFPFSVVGELATGILSRLARTGIVPLVAHPERYYLCTVATFSAWVAAGALLQVDATTVTRPTSRGDMARQLVEEGLAGILAADNHGDKRTLLTGRRFLEDRGAPEAAEWLTVRNPRAVLDDQPVSATPRARLKSGIAERIRTFMRRESGSGQ